MWRKTGRAGSAGDFFDVHRLEDPGRPRITLPDLEDFLLSLHAEQASEGFGYVEVRLAPRRFVLDGHELRAVLTHAHNAVDHLRDPTIRLILLLNRNDPDNFIGECETAIADGLPRTFAGIDLAGDERRHPEVDRFEPCFDVARRAGLGITVHAGEFGRTRDIWAALDRLGAQRIGHGIAAAGSLSLRTHMKWLVKSLQLLCH
jgi:adenosine deaminase